MDFISLTRDEVKMVVLMLDMLIDELERRCHLSKKSDGTVHRSSTLKWIDDMRALLVVKAHEKKSDEVQ